jgi:hypothetical protein
VILLDTDHINVLQSREPRAVTLMANMAASADQDFATTVITIEEQMRGWLAVIHRSTDDLCHVLCRGGGESLAKRQPAELRVHRQDREQSRTKLTAFGGISKNEFRRHRDL